MEKKSKHFLFMIFGGAVLIIVFFALVLFFAQYSAVNSSTVNNFITSAPSQLVKKEIKIYSISGKIKDIKGRQIDLETPIINDPANSSNELKLEIRQLEIDDNTQITRLNFISKEKNVKIPENPSVADFSSISRFKAEKIPAYFSDLKIGDNISADYSLSLTEIKNFIPKNITILPYTIY